MGVAQPAIFALNRGLLSPLALARTDLKRTAFSAQVMKNWMPRLLGSMMLRPGLGYVVGTNGNALAKLIPFVFSNTDVALLELTNATLRIVLPSVAGGQPDTVLTRPAVSSAITNGTFAGSLAGWTNADQAGATSAYAAGNFMELTGTGANAAIERQQVTVAPAGQNVEHGLRVVVTQAPINIRVGNASGDDSYLQDRRLGVGTHSLSFTPTGASFWIEFRNTVATPGRVQSVAVEGSGVVTLPTPWPASVLGPIALIRTDQSGDVIYVACDGYQQRKIQRTYGSTNGRSWSIVLYLPEDGPFDTQNTGGTTITPSATTGAITLSASDKLFRSGHVGALFRLASIGQHAAVAAGGTNQFSSAIKITGIGSARNFAITITGTFNATVVLQRSIASPGSWQDVPGESWTVPTTTTYTDGLDNQVVYYRIGIEATYVSGTANCAIDITTGTQNGVVRITSVASPISASAIVLTEANPTSSTTVLSGLGSVAATPDWSEGIWSDKAGWPTAVALYEGRLWWAGRDQINGSASDAYESYDDTATGDSATISRAIGSGPVDRIAWLLGLQRLVVGGQGAEKSARSSSFDSPLTPTDFLLKDASTRGSALIPAVKIDPNGVFIDKSRRRVYQLIYQPNYFMMDYTATDVTKFVPDIAIGPGGFTALAVQRQPDTRIHVVMANGQVALCVFDPTEDEMGWVLVDTAGTIEDVCVLPSEVEDTVYYVVNRTINGSTVRYIERWAREDECWGLPTGKCADAHKVYSGAATTSITGLAHLEGATVVVWGWNTATPFTNADGTAAGRDLGSYTVSGGAITLSTAVTDCVVGLSYTAQFQSVKLAYGAEQGSTALNQPKRVATLGVILANAHCQGLKYGPTLSSLYSLPMQAHGKTTQADTVYSSFDEQQFGFGGVWDSDARLCLQAQAPRPVTVLGVTMDIETRGSA